LNPSTISRQLGRISAAFQLHTYGHVLAHQKQEATRRLGEMLASEEPL
jgi:hypothetical protein